MKRFSVVAVLALAAVLVASAVAMAAQPVPGGIYKGKSTANDRVFIDVFNNGRKVKVAKVTDRCGVTWRLRRLEIDARGRFSGRQLDGGGDLVFKIRGRFVERRQITGKIDDTTCKQRERRSYAADFVRRGP